MTQPIKIAGKVTIRIDGEIVAESKNLVVDTGLEAFMQCFSGDPSYRPLQFMAGTGTTPPVAGDTAMETLVITKAFTSQNFPFPYAYYVTSDIVPGEATGVDFTEFGILAANGTTLIARIVDGNTYSKTALNTINITWEWRIQV